MNDLITEAQNLIDQLDKLLYSYYEPHPILGDIPRSGTGLQRRRINRILFLADRRLKRRRKRAGLPARFIGFEGLINSLDSSWF